MQHLLHPGYADTALLPFISLSVETDIETNCSLTADSNVNKSTVVVQGSFILLLYPLLSCCMVPKYQCGDDASLVFVEHLNSPVKPLSLPCLAWAPELSSPLISSEWSQSSYIGDKEELRSVNNAGIYTTATAKSIQTYLWIKLSSTDSIHGRVYKGCGNIFMIWVHSNQRINNFHVLNILR